MIKFHSSLLGYSKIAAGGMFLILSLSVLISKPKNINEHYRKVLAFNVPGDAQELAARKGLEEYLRKIGERGIFNFPSYDEASKKTLEEESLDRFSFNGIIVLDKKYLAIYDNKEKQQHLVLEGESLSGIKVKQIREDSAIIEMKDESMEINF